MITTIVTFVTEKIVAVVITTVIVVAAVPTLIVAIHGNTITITEDKDKRSPNVGLFRL